MSDLSLGTGSAVVLRLKDGSGAISLEMTVDRPGSDVQILTPDKGIVSVHLNPHELAALGRALIRMGSRCLSGDDERTERWLPDRNPA